MKPFSQHTYGQQRNWYGQLINLIREGAPDAASLAKNRLYIVTFNYDHSLERALEAALADTEVHSGASYKDAVTILHVNGSPSTLPESITDVGKFILECADSFHLAGEQVHSQLEDERNQIRNAITNAENIYVMGFNFDPMNVSAVGLVNSQNRDRIYCLNYDGHIGLRQKMLQAGVLDSNIISGSREHPLHLHIALENGFLEQ